MRYLFFVVFFNIILLKTVVWSTLNEEFGPLNFQVKTGTLPQKYIRQDENDQKASRKIVALVEKLRKRFPTGSKSFPPLDPLKKKKINRINFELPTLWINGIIYLKNFVLTGLQNFLVKNIEIRINSSRIDFHVILPLLSAKMDFKVQATMAFLPSQFSGHLNTTLKNLDISGAIGAERKIMKNRTVFQITSTELYAQAYSVKVHVSNLKYNGDVSDLGEGFSIGKWINSMKQDVSLAVTNEILQQINRGLRVFDADRFITYLLSDPGVMQDRVTN